MQAAAEMSNYLPVRAMTESSSVFMIVRMDFTPSSPPQAKPQRAGRPMNTIFAPSAIALNTSVPCLIPPSK